MSCAGCGHENPTGNRFCGACGAPLERSCPSCQYANPPDHRFCGGCGAALVDSPKSRDQSPRLGPSPNPSHAHESRSDPRAYTPKHLADKILQSKSALEGERKQVTVLFADVKGSMELAEQLDPEQWHTILDRFFAILTEGVHRFEGTVNQYTGDGIMALFGAPIAHEDHAHRACYAALHLRNTLKEYADALRVEHGLNFSVRMGINSGDVVVGRIGDDLRMDYTAQGLTVGLAQRMEALAEAGKAMLAGSTIDLVHGYFELRDLGAMKVKGVDTPVRVAELEGVGRMRTRLDRSRARGLSKFVGRDDEMDRLETALRRALDGDGQVVGVMAWWQRWTDAISFRSSKKREESWRATAAMTPLANTPSAPRHACTARTARIGWRRRPRREFGGDALRGESRRRLLYCRRMCEVHRSWQKIRTARRPGLVLSAPS